MTRWEDRIEAARRHTFLGVTWPRFVTDDRRLANDWRTCAVGEMRRRYGVRLDRNLGRLGMAFLQAVVRNDVEAAAATRHVIEEYALRSKRRQWEAARAGIADGERAAG